MDAPAGAVDIELADAELVGDALDLRDREQRLRLRIGSKPNRSIISTCSSRRLRRRARR
jgi:hypothetical protein